MAQRIRRLTSNQKIGGSNPSVVEFLLLNIVRFLSGFFDKPLKTVQILRGF